MVFGMALLTAMSWPPRARIFPFAIFGPILLLAIANFVKDLRRQPWTETINLAIAEANLDEFSFRKRTRDIVGWVLGFFGALAARLCVWNSISNVSLSQICRARRLADEPYRNGRYLGFYCRGVR